MHYVRFAVPFLDEYSQQPKGLFWASHMLLAEDIPEEDREELRSLFVWFSDNLGTPNRFCRSHRKHLRPTAICWFRPTATEHIARMRRIAGIYTRNDFPVQMHTTREPGYIVYEDSLQVAAIRFRDRR